MMPEPSRDMAPAGKADYKGAIAKGKPSGCLQADAACAPSFASRADWRRSLGRRP